MPEELKINGDFSQRVVVRPNNYRWTASPIKDVERMMLDRIGDEVARATTIVRYAPNSEFSSHTHDGGEEFFVLEGTFSDEYGDYPVGTYVRNPIGTSHTPKIGDNGCTIFVKLRQFDEQDTEQIIVNTAQKDWLPGPTDNLNVMLLHEHAGEHVALVKWTPNTEFEPHKYWGGAEVFVLQGSFYDEHGVYPKGSWLRSPHLSRHTPYTKEDGAITFVKTGHLPQT